MTSEEFRGELRRLGVSQHGFSRWLGLRDTRARKVRRWANGEAPIPDSIAEALRAFENQADAHWSDRDDV